MRDVDPGAGGGVMGHDKLHEETAAARAHGWRQRPRRLNDCDVEPFVEDAWVGWKVTGPDGDVWCVGVSPSAQADAEVDETPGVSIFICEGPATDFDLADEITYLEAWPAEKRTGVYPIPPELRASEYRVEVDGKPYGTLAGLFERHPELDPGIVERLRDARPGDVIDVAVRGERTVEVRIVHPGDFSGRPCATPAGAAGGLQRQKRLIALRLLGTLTATPSASEGAALDRLLNCGRTMEGDDPVACQCRALVAALDTGDGVDTAVEALEVALGRKAADGTPAPAYTKRTAGPASMTHFDAFIPGVIR